MLRRAFDAKFWGHITTIQAVLPHLAPSGSITLLGAVTARAACPAPRASPPSTAPSRPSSAARRRARPHPGQRGLARLVDTPWWSALPEDARRAYFAQAAQALPARRIATAEDIAEVVVLAATNPNLTGTIIETDGGARLVSLS